MTKMNRPAEQLAPDQLPEVDEDALPVELSDEDIFAEEVERRTQGEPQLLDPLPPENEDDPLPPELETLPPEGEAPPPEPPGGEEPPPEPPAGEGDTPPADDGEPEWFKALPDEAKAQFAAQNEDLTQLQGQYTALHGRLAPMQQENARLRSGGTPAAPTAAPATTPLPATRPVDATPSLDLSEVSEFVEFEKEFPDEAKAVAAIFGRQAQHISHLTSQLGDVSQGLQRIQSASLGQERDTALNKLATAHSDWMTVRPSADFANWCAAQPASIARMADSPDPDECIYVLDRYKQDVYLQRRLDEPTPPQNPQEPTSAPNAVRDRRRALRTVPSLDPQPSDVGVPQGNPEELMTDEEIWDAEVERRLRVQRDNRL